MGEKLEDAPWWVWSLITGSFFAVGMTVFNHFQQGLSWTAAAIGGLVMGVFFGAFMGPLVARLRRTTLAAAEGLSAPDLRLASRAVMRGPAPLNPNIRRAAARLARLQLKQYSGSRLWLGMLAFGTFSVLSGFLALTESPWWWIQTLMFLGVCAVNVMMPRHLNRRVVLLSQEELSHS